MDKRINTKQYRTGIKVSHHMQKKAYWVICIIYLMLSLQPAALQPKMTSSILQNKTRIRYHLNTRNSNSVNPLDTSPGSAHQCILGDVYLRSYLSRKPFGQSKIASDKQSCKQGSSHWEHVAVLSQLLYLLPFPLHWFQHLANRSRQILMLHLQ